MPTSRLLSLECPLPLRGVVQHYSWGRAAADSIIPSLTGEPAADRPYAELWFGAHPSAPARALLGGTEVLLDALIEEQPEAVLGPRVLKRFGPRLPFLFKVLSIRTALSIQAHPDKACARKLHARDPEHYPDDNHKPEAAIAVSPVSMLYGFRRPGDIARFCRRVPELAELFGAELCAALEKAEGRDEALLRRAYCRLFAAPPGRIGELCEKLYKRIAAAAPSEPLNPEEEWVRRLSGEYPEGDVGIFCFFLLNLAKRQRGEGVFIGPNIPHAYLEGELLECMANSDNVIRAGLTPKFKDVETLLAAADYSAGPPAVLAAQKDMQLSCCSRYILPAEEFALERLEGTAEGVPVGGRQSVELLFCMSGEAVVDGESPFGAGTALLLPARMPKRDLRLKMAELYRIGVPNT